jgi:uncharacterized protein
MQEISQIPWYRQFWPWFLIALPALALLAGAVTWSIAVRHADPIVPEYTNAVQRAR